SGSPPALGEQPDRGDGAGGGGGDGEPDARRADDVPDRAVRGSAAGRSSGSFLVHLFFRENNCAESV
ncbi:MAG: hypothetical protein R6U19_03220, partial [Bacteroidales bacterium]